MWFLCGSIMMNYEDNYNGGKPFYSFESFELYELFAYLYSRYVLSFPLVVINYFTDKYLWITMLFIIPNTLVVAKLIAIARGKREKNKILTK